MADEQDVLHPMNEIGDFGELLATQLRDGRPVTLDDSERGLTVHVGREHYVLPYPSHGFAGHGFVVSADERWLVLWRYDGQGREDCDVFHLGPLRLVHSFHVLGEGYPPVLSPDSRHLAFAWATNPALASYAEPEGTERIEWLHLRVTELPDAARTCRIMVELSPDYPGESDDNYYAEKLRFTNDGRIAFDTAWGEAVSLPIDPPAETSVKGP